MRVSAPLRCFLVVLNLAIGSCASVPELDLVLGESPRAGVYLERFSNRAPHATHPIKLSQEVLTQILQGLIIEETQGVRERLLSGPNGPTRVFTDQEVRYLAPLLAEGFLFAAADQQVGFRVSQPSTTTRASPVGAAAGASNVPLSASLMETTRGALYVSGSLVSVTLREYQLRTERADTIYGPNRRMPDRTGLQNHTLSFLPEAVSRPGRGEPSVGGGVTILIDYERLAALSVTPAIVLQPTPPVLISPGVPATIVRPSHDATTAEQLFLLQEQMRQKSLDLEELRKELQDIRRTQPSLQKTAPSTPR